MTAHIYAVIEGTVWSFVSGLGLAVGVVIVFLAVVALVLRFAR